MELGNFCMSLAVKDIKVSREFYEKLGFTSLGFGDESQKWIVLQNGTTKIGLFEGFFENNILTFNPGWNSNAEKLTSFTDVRSIQQELKAKGINFTVEADTQSSGPAHCMLTDPDGNTILIDQHV